MPLSKEILKIATLGTAHNGMDVSVLGKSEHLERQLLRTIAGTKLPERAGWIPMVDEKPLPEPFPADERPMCSFETMQFFLRMVRYGERNRWQNYAQLGTLSLNYWFDRVKDREQQIAPEYLQLILEMVTRFPHSYFQLYELIDPYSREIAAEYPFEDVLLRIMWLRDKNLPQRGHLLETQWQKTASTKTGNFLERLEHQVIAQDEAFLESLIDTASSELLHLLRGLLAELPSSKFSELMVDYVRRLAHIEDIGGKQWLMIDRLERVDDSILRRYGIVEDKTNAKTAIQRILSYVPPAFWCKFLGVSHETFVELVVNNKKFSSTLWKSLVVASHYHQDTRFVDDIFRHSYLRLDQREKGLIVKLVSVELLQDAAIEFLEQRTETYSQGHPAQLLIHECQVEWRPELVDAFIRVMRRTVNNAVPISYRFQDVIVQSLFRAAFFAPLTMRHEILSIFDDYDDSRGAWRNVRERMQRIMEFRQELLDVLETGSI